MDPSKTFSTARIRWFRETRRGNVSFDKTDFSYGEKNPVAYRRSDVELSEDVLAAAQRLFGPSFGPRSMEYVPATDAVRHRSRTGTILQRNPTVVRRDTRTRRLDLARPARGQAALHLSPGPRSRSTG